MTRQTENREQMPLAPEPPFDSENDIVVAKPGGGTTHRPMTDEEKAAVAISRGAKPDRAPAPKKWGEDIKLDKGLTTLTSLDEQIRFAKLLIDKKMVSETFVDPAAVVLGIQYAKALKMEPIVGLKMMYVVDGRVTIFGDGPLGLAWRSKQLQSCEEFWIDEHGERITAEKKNLRAKVYGAVTRLTRVGDPAVQEDFFTLDDLALAGIDKKASGQKKATWSKYERIMMRYKARTIALKSKCPDLMNGLGIAEYDFDFSPQTPSVPARSVNDEPKPKDDLRALLSPTAEVNE